MLRGPLIAFYCALVGIIIPTLATADDRVIVYGGLSYLDDTATPMLSSFLQGRAKGDDLILGNRLYDSAFSELDRFNAAGTLKGFSEYPVATNREQARAIAARLGASEAALVEPISAIQLHGDGLFALVLLGTYENLLEEQVTFYDAGQQRDQLSTRSTLITGVNALLLEIDPDADTRQIVTAGFGLGEYTIPLRGDRSLTDQERAAIFKVSYDQAIRAALTNLRGAARSSRTDKDVPTAMVTGFTIMETAAPYFGYDLARKPSLAQVRENACALPDACKNGECRRMGALLTNGLTAALSEAGMPVLPPLGSQYHLDTDRAIRINLNLHNSEIDLLGAHQAVEIDPGDASAKYIAVLRAVASGDTDDETYRDVLINRSHLAQIGYVRLNTGFDGCTAIGEAEIYMSTESHGCSIEKVLKNRDNSTMGASVMRTRATHYALAAAHNLNRMPVLIKGGRNEDSIDCNTISSTH